MAGQAAIAFGSAILGSILNKKANKATQPEPMMIEQPPAITQAPAAASASPAVSPEAQAATIQQRKRAQAAQGRGSTIKTGGGGLGEIDASNLQSKTLLGY